MSVPTNASGLEAAVLLGGRLLLATIFLHEGIAKLGNYSGAVAYAKAFGVPEALLPLAIAAELGCGLLIALGLYTRTAAVVLAGFCVATAVLFHSKFGDRNQLLHFEKNLGLAGGFLLLSVAGPGRLSLGRLLARKD
jgi:putative oxidoreductase